MIVRKSERIFYQLFYRNSQGTGLKFFEYRGTGATNTFTAIKTDETNAIKVNIIRQEFVVISATIKGENFIV